MKKIKYDTKKYCFVEELKILYGVDDLQKIHEQWSGAKKYELLNDVETDQRTVYHKHFYEAVGKTRWYEIYDEFIKEIIRPIFSETILYQKIPTFRVHQPGNLAVAAYHRDRDYAHSKHEVNFFLPLTPAFGTNTIWVESKEDKGDYAPFVSNFGECIMWDGANLRHGNKTNATPFSRVSVDFRILPESKYVINDRHSITNNTKMVVGEYYKKI